MVYMPDLMGHIAQEYGFAAYDFSEAYGACDGYVIDRTMSLRSAWQPLELAFAFDPDRDRRHHQGCFQKGHSAFVPMSIKSACRIRTASAAASWSRSRGAQESELARGVRITYLNANKAYNSGTVTAWNNFADATNVSESQLAIVMDEDRARGVAEYLLQDVWAARESGQFALMPSLLALEPGDVLEVTTQKGAREMRLTDIKDGEGRPCEASGFMDAGLSVSGVRYSLRFTQSRYRPNAHDCPLHGLALAPAG